MSAFLEATSNYEDAYKLGKKAGGHLQYLDQILEEKNIRLPKESSLGTLSIPVDQIVGTKTEGRASSFSSNFLPTLGPETEFARKWINVCAYHLDEGINDPILAYEFLNKFYVVEGNKRVSVMKFFDSPSIQARVIRIIPPYNEDSKEIRIYYEYMKFYALSTINYIYFSKEGSFDKLQKLVGKTPQETWTHDDKLSFKALYYRFLENYQKLELEKLSIYPGDAFLYLLELYDYPTLLQKDFSELVKIISSMQNEFKLLETDDAVQLHMDPADSKKKNILKRLLPTGVSYLKVAFIHKKSSETSGWTYLHELGRIHLENQFPGQVVTSSYNGATKENAKELLEQAIADGNRLIFTTSPYLAKISLQTALEHPEVKILNCSLHNSHKSMRTYSFRMHEAKFILGAIAGSMTPNDKIGYVTSYPIHEAPSINAFALGAKMVNPRARIYLPDAAELENDADYFVNHDIPVVCGKDMTSLGLFDPGFGLYMQRDGRLWNMAMPIWDWGKFYEKMIQNILSGDWDLDDTTNATSGLSYWWGLSSGVVDVVFSRKLPSGTRKLAQLLKDNIIDHDFSPFTGTLYSQEGIIQPDPNYRLTPKEIFTMEWLSDNVIGHMPKVEEENLDEIM